MRKLSKGFTLVEIMIVVAIIAILAAVAIPNFVRYRKTSQMNACISNLKQIQTAVEQAKMDGTYTTKANVIGSTLYIKVEPTCPANKSTYTWPDATDDTGVPECSYSDSDTSFVHALPTATN